MYTIAVVGASGAVGRKIVEILADYQLPIANLYLFASSKSAGSEVDFGGKTLVIEELNEQSFDRHIDIALFAAGGHISQIFAPIAASKGIIVIDNSSVFRMEASIPLVVPEINIAAINLEQNRIIANPNCSTIQSVVALAPLEKAFGLAEVSYTTYQAVSGSGQKGINDLERGMNGLAPQNYPHPIYNNVIPQIDDFLANGYTKEEMKMIAETQKILDRADLPVDATCVRVPVFNSHSVAIRFRLNREANVDAIRAVLAQAKGVVVIDHPEEGQYPMPLTANDTDDVYVGRIRQDLFDPQVFDMFVVADNIRKGAASNAVQIAQYILERGTENENI